MKPYLSYQRRIICFIALWLCITGAAAQKLDFMLASRYEADSINLADYYVSEKLDGVRAYWDGERLHSRGGNIFAAPQWFIAALPPTPLDGELWRERGQFEAISGAVRRKQPDEAWRGIRLMVFDMPDADGDFTARLQKMHKLWEAAGNEHWQIIEQQPAPLDEAELQQLLRQRVAAGAEGLMLRRKDSAYRGGRTLDLIKLKPHTDAEAIVIAHNPGKGKYKGLMGSITVEHKDGRQFRIGSGFTDHQRRHPPPIGSTITYRHHGHTNTGLPRFAVFLRIRADEPEAE